MLRVLVWPPCPCPPCPCPPCPFTFSPSLCHHISVTILSSQVHYHNFAVKISLYHHLAFSLSPSQSRRYHLAVTIFHRPLTSSAIWQTRMSLSVGKKKQKLEETLKPRVRSAPDGSDKKFVGYLFLNFLRSSNKITICNSPFPLFWIFWIHLSLGKKHGSGVKPRLRETSDNFSSFSPGRKSISAAP